MRLRRSAASIKLDQETNRQTGKLINEIRQKYLSEISKKLRAEIVKMINAEWRDIATRKLTGSRAKYLARYLQGIAPAEVVGDSIMLNLTTADSIKIEAGWAPPQKPGSKIEDGIGTYDGTAKDLRPLLLHSGKPPNRSTFKGNRTGANGESSYAWKVIKFDIEGSQSEIENIVTDWLKSKAAQTTSSYQIKLAKRANKMFKKGMEDTVKEAKANRDRTRRRTGVSSGSAYLPEEATSLMGNTKTVLWSENQKANLEEIHHRRHIFAKMRVQSSGRKLAFATFRTISDNPNQRSKWRAVGIPPAYIMSGDPQGDDLIHRIAKILVDKGFERVLRSSTNLIPSYSQHRVNLGSADSPATLPTVAAKAPVLAGAPAAPPANPVVASMASRSSTPSAPTPSAPPAQAVSQASPAKINQAEDPVYTRARAMLARDYPNALEQQWARLGSFYMENARAIINRESYSMKDKIGDASSVVEATKTANAVNQSAQREKSLNYTGNNT